MSKSKTGSKGSRKIALSLEVRVEVEVPQDWGDDRVKQALVNEITWLADSAPRSSDMRYIRIEARA